MAYRIGSAIAVAVILTACGPSYEFEPPPVPTGIYEGNYTMFGNDDGYSPCEDAGGVFPDTSITLREFEVNDVGGSARILVGSEMTFEGEWVYTALWELQGSVFSEGIEIGSATMYRVEPSFKYSTSSDGIHVIVKVAGPVENVTDCDGLQKWYGTVYSKHDE